MKIGVCSDLHLEHGRVNPLFEEIVNTECDVIVLAGDISSYKDVRNDILDIHTASGNRPIVMVAGNHEFYGTSRKTFEPILKELSTLYPSIHILCEDTCMIDDVLFIGSTGWWDGSNGTVNMTCKHGLNDFRLIYDLMDKENEDGIVWGKKSKRFFEESLYQSHMNGIEKVVCISHHMPSKQCIAPQFYGSPINTCFANDWDGMIENYQPDLWISGHTHSSYDFKIGKTRMICNPQGYPSINQRMVNGQLEETWMIENPKFNPSLVIEI